MRQIRQAHDNPLAPLHEARATEVATGYPHTARSKRSHPWHASYSVLAVLTSMLILNGYENKGPAEQAGTPFDQAAPKPKEDTETENAARANKKAGMPRPFAI